MKNLLLIIATTCLLASCSPSYKILKSDKESGFRLIDYPTFGFYNIEAKGDTVANTFEANLDVIRASIKRSLELKGLTEAQEPALKVNIGITVKEQVQTRQTNFQNDGRPLYMGQRRYSWKSKEVEVGRYKDGTLLIDLVDTANNKMVWSGGGEGIIPTKKEQFEQQINELTDKIFKPL